MTGIIDYAGMYPPTNLPLEDAFRNFVTYQNNPNVWMLSRFVVPAKRLGELSKLAEIFPKDKPLSFACLGRGGKAAEEFLANLDLDLIEMLAFRKQHGDRVVVDMFEVALPISELNNRVNAHELVIKSAEALNKNGISIFFEAPFGDGWQERAEILIRSLRKIKDKHVGFKLRTGGVTANAFLTPAQLAWAIMSVREAGILMKCTAGLHHPIRHYNASVATKMHGFLNVFGASLLALTNDLSQDDVESIIADEDSAHFIFDDEGFSWKDWHVTNAQILAHRQNITSFGSCSFDEPLEDLQKLKLL